MTVLLSKREAAARIGVNPATLMRMATEGRFPAPVRLAWRIDTSAVESDEALEIAATMGDWLNDCDGIWGLCSMSERLGYARDFAELCQQIEGHGYLCHMGHHRQRSREKGKPDLVFVVGLMVILPKEGADRERYGIVHLEGAWETLEEDRCHSP